MSESATGGARCCPHCGGDLDLGLAQHMAVGQCDATDSPANSAAPKTLPDRHDDLPVLEDAGDAVSPDPTLKERRELADELADAGVWG